MCERERDRERQRKLNGGQLKILRYYCVGDWIIFLITQSSSISFFSFIPEKYLDHWFNISLGMSVITVVINDSQAAQKAYCNCDAGQMTELNIDRPIRLVLHGLHY